METLSDGWQHRQRDGEDGQRVDYLERAVEGKPGTVERFYGPGGGEVREADAAHPISLGNAGGRHAFGPPAEAQRRVVVTDSAREAILRRASWDNADEQGGPLLGRIVDGQVEVVHALDGARNRTPVSVELDLHRGGRLDDTIVLGDWHTHPGSDPVPSRTDLTGWESGYRHVRPDGAPFWVGLVVTAPKYGTPELHAYTVTLDGYRTASL